MATTLHSQGAALSPAAPSDDPGPNNASIASFLQHQPTRHRYSSSRSNSVSGSSVSTVKRVASRSSSRTDTRGSILPLTPHSPGDTSLLSARLTVGTGKHAHSRRKSGAVDPSEHFSVDPLPHRDRWSNSTDSSLTSNSNSKAYQTSGGPISASSATAHPLLPPRPAPGYANDNSPRDSPQHRPTSSRSRPKPRPVSPLDSPDRGRGQFSRPRSRGNPLAALTSPNFAHRDDTDFDSFSTAMIGMPSPTDLISPSYAQDYFPAENASPRSLAKGRRPAAVIRQTTAPGTSLNYSRMPRAEAVQESAHNRRRSEQLGGPEAAPATTPAIGAQHPPDERREKSSRTKDRAEREKKAMLSKALEKANTAVVLDNDQDFKGALEAYSDACTLLQQVMDRSGHADDRRKLEDIRITYTNRITELAILEASRVSTEEEEHDKVLPNPPTSDAGPAPAAASAATSNPANRALRDSATLEMATAPRVMDGPRLAQPKKDRDSFYSRTMADVDRAGRAHEEESAVRRRTREAIQRDIVSRGVPAYDDGAVHIISQRVSRQQASDASVPTQSSPRKHSPPTREARDEDARQRSDPSEPAHDQDSNDAAASWLDTIDESGSSCSSSVHSLSSQRCLRRKHLHGTSGGDDAGLDAAFDAAVEAAYDEGLEPDVASRATQRMASSHARNPSLVVSSGDIKEMLSPTAATFQARPIAQSLDEDEEERLLDEIAQDYGHGFNFDLGTKSALPRQSDSSGYSRSTWQSSQASEHTTAGTSLSTVAENDLASRDVPHKKPARFVVGPVNTEALPPSAPPPLTALPLPPSLSQVRGMSTVRSRRLSGQNAKDLVIETSIEPPQNRNRASTQLSQTVSYPESDGAATDSDMDATVGMPLESSVSDVQHEHILKSPPSLGLLSRGAGQSGRSLSLTSTEHRSVPQDGLGQLHSSRPNLYRKNQSSLSLRADHTVLLPSPHGTADLAEPTPMSATFSKLKYAQDPLTSQRVAFPTLTPQLTHASASGGTYLFDTSLSAPQAPSSPPPSSHQQQQPPRLEPCPESTLLRPFWLMRSIASTITHPHGGFLTTRLFVPREVWQTRGVKLKAVEDKVANCDLLTAALGHLADVDTLDADAVMDELQHFEEVMERVQAALLKRLGSDVGVHGVSGLFKDAALSTAAAPTTSGVAADGRSDTPSSSTATATATDKGARSISGKSYLPSWRKLRSKSSGAPMSGGGAVAAAAFLSGRAPQDRDAAAANAHSMASVPMTSFVPVERRGQRKDARNLSFDGPNREYMASLARLFQGVQALDQIARQVEDPGLKHSSPTHVGLELSIRHAAEFFAFYVCRFVLVDLGTLLDKFVKRGTEWVMA